MRHLSTFLRGGWLIGLITVQSCLAFFLFGYDNGMLSNLIDDDAFLAQYNPSTWMLANVVSFLSLGAAIGAFVAFFLMEDLGRRSSMYLGTGLLIIGAIVQATSQTADQLLAGRIVCGLGLGINTSAVPAWQSECVPKEQRGSLMSTDLLWVTGGALFAYWFDYGVMRDLSGQVVFRLPIAFQLVFQATMMILMPFLPESPRWLALHGHRQKALEVLAQLEGGDTTPDSESVQAQYNAIINAAELEGYGDSNNFAILFKGGNLRRVALGVGVNLMNPWSGINIVTYYFPYILTTVLHKSSHTSAIISGCSVLASVLGVLPTIIFIDRIGRKRLLCAGSASLCVCYAILTGLMSKMTRDPDAKGVGEAAIFIIFLYNVIFSLTWLPTSFLYCAELIPLRLRSKGCALGTMCYWLGTFATAEILPTGIANISWRFSIIFICLNGAIAVVIAVFYRETASLSLEQIELLYVAGPDSSDSKDLDMGKLDRRVSHV